MQMSPRRDFPVLWEGSKRQCDWVREIREACFGLKSKSEVIHGGNIPFSEGWDPLPDLGSLFSKGKCQTGAQSNLTPILPFPYSHGLQEDNFLKKKVQEQKGALCGRVPRSGLIAQTPGCGGGVQPALFVQGLLKRSTTSSFPRSLSAKR